MKKLASTLGTFIFYSYFTVLLSLFCKFILHIQLMQSNLEHIYWVNMVADISFIIVFIALNYKVLINNEFDGNSVLNKIFIFIVRLFILFLIFFVIKVLFAVITYYITEALHLSSQTNNQEMLERIIKIHPFGMFISVAVFAPIVEELIFRGSVRKVITNDILFVFTSGLLFGLVHVLKYHVPIIILLIAAVFINIVFESKISKKRKILSTVLIIIGMFIIMGLSLHLISGNLLYLLTHMSMSEAINSITYIAMGMCFAYVYKRYNNIYLSMGIHSLNNILGFVLLMFTL